MCRSRPVRSASRRFPAVRTSNTPSSTLGRLVDAEQFADIVLKTGTDGEVTYLKDVARTELGARSQDTLLRWDGKPSAGIGIFQLPGSNALDTGDAIKAKMRELGTRFPKGLGYAIVYDTTPFVRESVNEVLRTLRDAVILVAIVILLFLQDWRALLLPVIDVAVSLVGTFAVMKLMGFSLNNLTLFGLVLAIGIVVDDAIVVLENIERWLDKGLPVREATIRAMNEITGPILAITLVLSSVLLPSAFLGGLTGQFFRQFALTISVSMLISALNAMTMTPARAAWIFSGRKPGEHGDQGKEALPWWSFALFGGLATVWLLAPNLGAWLGLPVGGEGSESAPGGLQSTLHSLGVHFVLFLPGAVAGGVLGRLIIRPVNWALGRLFQGFNWVFDRATQIYGRTVGWFLRLSAIVVLVYVGLIGMTGFGFSRVPGGFVPSQDKGYLLANIQLPDSASLERTTEVTQAVEKIALEIDGVAHTVAIPGQSFVLNALSPNYGSMFIILKPFSERRAAELTGEAILSRLRARLQSEVPEARVLVFGAPAVQGLGNAGGFKLMVEATGDVNFDALQAQADNLATKGNEQPGLVGLFNGFRSRTPQLYADIDRTKVKTMGVQLTDVFDALQAYLGSYYVNDFNRFGRTWQVNIQADASFRANADTVRQLKIRNADGDMVPLGAVADVRDSAGPVQITRYNMFPAAAINGASLPEVSTGDVLSTMEKLARELPRNMTTEWSELSYLQKQSSKIEQIRDLQQNPFRRFCPGGGARVLRLGRLIRELVAAVGGDLGRANVSAECLSGHRDGPHGCEYLRASRLRRACRPGRQECDSDRRVRPRQAVGGCLTLRRRRGSRPRAAATDPDDVVCVHSRRVSPRHRSRGGSRDAADPRHRGLLRHDRRDIVRHLPDPRVLFSCALAQPAERRRACSGRDDSGCGAPIDAKSTRSAKSRRFKP